MPVIDNALADVLATLCAVMALKLMVAHFLTARARVMSKTFDKWGRGGGDVSITSGLFTVMMMAVGPDFGGKDFIEMAHNYCKNCAENEPFFVLMVFFCGLTNRVASETLTLLTTYFMYARVLHAVLYLVGPLLPSAIGMTPRSTAWMGGFMLTVYVAVLMLV
jgi:uncharacterized MAPEG superfamily protein